MYANQHNRTDLLPQHMRQARGGETSSYEGLIKAVLRPYISTILQGGETPQNVSRGSSQKPLKTRETTSKTPQFYSKVNTPPKKQLWEFYQIGQIAS